VATIFADPNWIESAIFTAPPAAGIPVTIYRGRHDPIIDFPGFQNTARAAGWEAHLRQTEVPTVPRKGTDTLTIGALTYGIRDVFEDTERTEWVCDLIEQ